MIVLDTHALVWWLDDPAKLSPPARRAIKRASDDAAVVASAVSLFEISTLLRRGRLEFGVDSERWFGALQSLPELVVEPVSMEIARVAGSYGDELPGDPADRMIAATAQILSAMLVTADEKLRSAASVDVVW